MSDPFEAKGEPVELVQGFPYRGGVKWHASDIQGFRPDWTLERCDEWLHNNRKYIIDRSIELGHEVIETLLEIEDE